MNLVVDVVVYRSCVLFLSYLSLIRFGYFFVYISFIIGGVVVIWKNELSKLLLLFDDMSSDVYSLPFFWIILIFVVLGISSVEGGIVSLS